MLAAVGQPVPDTAHVSRYFGQVFHYLCYQEARLFTTKLCPDLTAGTGCERVTSDMEGEHRL